VTVKNTSAATTMKELMSPSKLLIPLLFVVTPYYFDVSLKTKPILNASGVECKFLFLRSLTPARTSVKRAPASSEYQRQARTSASAHQRQARTSDNKR